MSTYIDHRSKGRRVIHSWTHHTSLNLAQHYDPARVVRIMTGTDPKTQADVARWEALGRRSAA